MCNISSGRPPLRVLAVLMLSDPNLALPSATDRGRSLSGATHGSLRTQIGVKRVVPQKRLYGRQGCLRAGSRPALSYLR